jgi:hypothetical protein
MEDERWLTHLLNVCRSELHEAQNAEFPPFDSYVEDLGRVIDDLERRLARRASER